MRGLGLDAYLVGGAVRDEQLGLESKDADFVVPGVDYDGLRARSSHTAGWRTSRSPARVESARVSIRRTPGPGRSAGRDRVRAAACRAQHRSGRHDFEIVADPDISIEDDLARRDFTVNAMAKQLATGTSSTRSTAPRI